MKIGCREGSEEVRSHVLGRYDKEGSMTQPRGTRGGFQEATPEPRFADKQETRDETGP